MGLIPARGGSKRLPGKNLLKFNHPEFGKISLLEIAIRVAKQSKYLDSILVTSDDEFIRLRANAFGAATLIEPPLLATDSTRMQNVALHAYFSCPHDLIALLQPTSPYRTAQDIDACIEIAPAFSVTAGQVLPNGAVYVSGTDCDFTKGALYEMPTSRSLDIDYEHQLNAT